jgi:hypothetical protein
MLNREAYIAKLKLQLDELDATLASLEAKAAQAKASAREKYEIEMSKLRLQSLATQKKFEELKGAGEDKWDATVAEMEKVRDALIHSYNYFKSQL